MSEPRLSVLFLCTGNSARSQMAEAILRHLSHGAIEVESAGTEPKSMIHPMARLAVRTQFGLEMTGQYPKALDPVMNRHFDYIVTVCDRAAESCPVPPGDSERIHWSFEDPAAATGTDEERQRAFDLVARQLMGRMRVWLSLPALRNRIGAQGAERSR
jgi:ArsR family transcriptional regulator, arsenate/arsenite/antimonite-responsive transcriptional repressor / arsenate reductase (thioredoxin)